MLDFFRGPIYFFEDNPERIWLAFAALSFAIFYALFVIGGTLWFTKVDTTPLLGFYLWMSVTFIIFALSVVCIWMAAREADDKKNKDIFSDNFCKS